MKKMQNKDLMMFHFVVFVTFDFSADVNVKLKPEFY